MKHALFNQGFGKVETVVVLGVGRGGTSVVAGSLRALGVCMGASPHSLKHEWSPVVYATDEQVDLAPTRENIEQMNRDHEMWGWKSPIDVFSLDRLLPLLRHPGLIVTTRDLMEVSHSVLNYSKIPIEIGFYESATIYQLIADRLRFWPYPALAMSFAEITRKPAEFVDLLCSFLAITPPDAVKRQAIDFVQPGQNAYRRFDGKNREEAAGIPEQEIKADAEGSARGLVERYAKGYKEAFDDMLGDGRIAVKILCEKLTERNKFAIADRGASRIRELMTYFQDGGHFSAMDSGFNQRGAPITTETECAAVFTRFLDSLAESGREIEREIYADGKESAQRYADLAKLHERLQILIRIRTEVQRCLDAAVADFA